MRGIVIAGTHSGCGKTTITLGILAALKKKGLKVQSFKTGPDFIDSGLHRMITERPSRNLDLWMCGEDYVKDCFRRNSADADISVVEGVMGLYDGSLSTASLSACLGLPVILVIDAFGMAETAGAITKGFLQSASDKGINLAGVIFNRVASENHLSRLIGGVRDIKVLGHLPRDLDFEIPHRHLGLTTAEEYPLAEENIGRLADNVLRHIDIEEIVKIRHSGKNGSQETCNLHKRLDSGLRPAGMTAQIRLAVARDRAFCFYYEDNLDLLRAAGAELVSFSPLSDTALPENISGLYIGGGYPELYAGQLSKNGVMLDAIRAWAESGRPLYAECGGLMYISEGIHDFDGNFFRMAGVYPFETLMKKGRARLGYREVMLKEDCIAGKKGQRLRGHEFHYSEIVTETMKASSDRTLYSLMNSSGDILSDEGFSQKKTLASYVHLHFGSNPGIASELVNSCRAVVPSPLEGGARAKGI
ncbi:MAG: cobyrinate a,c-diamide synthase [Nitrospirae bacterium]|nr:cobyrinate a,c-diamide synthase [Nitrospirota bacterium]